MIYSFSLDKTGIQDSNRIISLVENHLKVIPQTKQLAVYTYYDTFDWRLYTREFYLYVLEKEIFLYNYSKKIVIQSGSCEQSKRGEVLDIGGKLRKNISPFIDARALLRVATFQRNQQAFRLLDRNQKTIATMKIVQNKIKAGSGYKRLIPCFEFEPLRGYDKEVKSILKKIPSKNIISVKQDLLKQGLSLLEKVPGSYASKFSISLSSQVSAGKALKHIYLHLLQVMKLNEYGIIKDFDTEFLHDFRVAIRRSRSGLSQLRGILSPEITFRAINDFASIGQSTNNLRDIDVYLLNESVYRKMLPGNLQKNLDPFFTALRETRAKEHRRVVRMLHSQKYNRSLNNWEQFLMEQDSPGTAGGQMNKPIIEIARVVIWKRNQRIVKFGRKIMQNSTDELLHKLRIEAKKLRYLLEFFSSLFPQKQIQRLILNLKKLQDNLGEFNDLVLQQTSLKNFSDSLSLEIGLSRETILTLGILIGKLHEKEKSAKKSFAKKFNQYSDQNIQKIFYELFGGRGKGVK